MRKDSAHVRNHYLRAAAEILANGAYFPNTLLTLLTTAHYTVSSRHMVGVATVVEGRRIRSVGSGNVL
jgi:hypothetical protein